MNSKIQKFYQQHKDKKWNYDIIPKNENSRQWTTWESKYPWLKLMIDAPFKEMLEEAKNIKHLFVEHRTDYSQGWKSVCIHGIDDHVTSIPEDHGFSKDAKRDWTNASAECPITTNYFKNKYPVSVYDRIRFMLIEPGGYIDVHVDGSREDNPSRAVNMSLNNPDGCFLITEEGIVPYDDNGSVFYFNIAYEHGVINNSNEDRYHIIVHGMETPEFEDIVLKSYQRQLTLRKLDDFLKFYRKGFIKNKTQIGDRFIFEDNDFSVPDTMYSHIENLMLDLNYTVPDELEQFAWELRESVKALENGYYVINTEPVLASKLNDQVSFETKFDNFIGVCGGIKTYILLGQEYFSENTNVLMFDISPAAIKWHQFLREKWNGQVEHFASLVEMFEKIHPEFKPVGLFGGREPARNLRNFLEDNNVNARQLKRGWKRFRNMNVTYEQLDVCNTEDVNRLIQHTKLGTNTYFWLSNCFIMERLVFKYGTEETWVSEVSFRKDFRSKSHTPCVFDVGEFIYV